MAGRRPPMNILVDENPRRLCGGTVNKINAVSSRSIASSITFSEVSSTDDAESGLFDPFSEESFTELNDRLPGIPQRRTSLLSVSAANVRAAATRAAADAAPALPSRQRSVASGGSESGSQRALDRLSDGSSSTTNTEPLPDYLQPVVTGEIASKLTELAEKADLFKRVVDIRDRKYGIRTFKQCFVGAEAVDRMIETGLASDRTNAVELGRSWMRYLGLFRHVTDGHDFKDRYLFYEFKSQSSTNKPGGKKWGSRGSSSTGLWYSNSVQGQHVTIEEDHPL